MSVNPVYAGVGARDTPQDICDTMVYFAKWLAGKGFTLRSGGAPGADQAFEKGCDKGRGRKLIYLPWESFENNKSPFTRVSEEALDIARQHHAAWDECSDGAKKLLARNVYQMIGLNCVDNPYPSSFVLCWTEDEEKGGTAFALKLAKAFSIPYFNMATADDLIDSTAEFVAQFVTQSSNTPH